MKTKLKILILACVLEAAFVITAQAQTDSSADDPADLAKKLANPIAALISVPFQNNFDFGAGPDGDGFQYKLNIQPVIAITLNSNWNIISRTILPYVTRRT